MVLLEVGVQVAAGAERKDRGKAGGIQLENVQQGDDSGVHEILQYVLILAFIINGKKL